MGSVPNYQGSLGTIGNYPEAFDQYIRVYNDLGAAVAEGDVYFLDWKRDADSLAVAARPTLVACATSAVARQVVVVTEAIADKAWGTVQWRGHCKKVAAASTTAVDDYLQGVNASAVSGDDGTSQTADSFGIAITDEDTVAGFCEAVLFGTLATIG